MQPIPFSIAALLILPLSAATAADQAFNDQVRPLLKKYCVECHGPEKAKGKLRLDQIADDFDSRANRDKWLLIVKRVKAGEMPTDGRPAPPAKEIETLSEWVGAKASVADAKRAAEGRVVLRRLNRTEYENSVRDLLGVSVNLKEQLPQDGAAEGFDNIGSALHISSFLMEKYLEAADTALSVAIANSPKPPRLINIRTRLDEAHVVKTTKESVYRKSEKEVVCFSSSHWHMVAIAPFYPPDRGYYRFRISASAVQSGDKPVTFRVTIGGRLTGKNGLVGYYDAPADKPKVFEIVQYMEPRTTISILPYGLASGQAVSKVGADDWIGPGLAVQYVEVEGPLNDTWPPENHRRLFGDQAQAKAPTNNDSNRVELTSTRPEADADRILRPFIRRAFRRAATDADVKPYVALVQAKLAEKHTFEQAVRAAMAAVMVSPAFLFLPERKGKLDDFALASRLSYFLWSSIPDEELLAVAEAKKLTDPQVLRAQVERMLKSPKAAAFTENFVGQWLGLRDIDFTEPSYLLYPEFDHMLKVSMIRETELFFAEILKEDLSLTNFVASDFTMLNGRLAKHYGVPGIDGWEFRKVTLPPNSHRGGVLTMASVLKVTANGTTTSPVTRGAWILDRILGTPPSPPPEGVAALEPDTRGAVTIRQQLEKHRQVATCAACHAKIDPPGFALESFDVIGGWRDWYRVTGNGKEVKINDRRMQYREGKKVDPSDVMPDGSKFRDVDEFKQLLLRDKDQLARALAGKLLTYGTGGLSTPGNKADIEAIVQKVRDKNYGFRTLVHEVVQSRVFCSK
jgi:mono/diheme cytochrome c family protein